MEVPTAPVSSEQVVVSFIIQNITPNSYITCSEVKKNISCLKRTDPIMVTIQQFHETSKQNGLLEDMVYGFVETFSYSERDPQDYNRFSEMVYAKFFQNGQVMSWHAILQFLMAVNVLTAEAVESFDKELLQEIIRWTLRVFEEKQINRFILSRGGWPSIDGEGNLQGTAPSSANTSPRRNNQPTTSPQRNMSPQRSSPVSPERMATNQQYRSPRSPQRSPQRDGSPPRENVQFNNPLAPPSVGNQSPSRSPPQAARSPTYGAHCQPSSPYGSNSPNADLANAFKDRMNFSAPPSAVDYNPAPGPSSRPDVPSYRARGAMGQRQAPNLPEENVPALSIFSQPSAPNDDFQDYDDVFADPLKQNSPTIEPRSRSPLP